MKHLGSVVVAVTACGPSIEHVSVAPLPPDPTPAQRQWAWDTYRPTGAGMEHVTLCTSDRSGTHCDTTHRPFVTFPDQRRVEDPGDLAPLVAPGSRTMVEAERAYAAEDKMRMFGLGEAAGVVGGLVVTGYGHSIGNDTVLITGISVVVASILVGGIGHVIEKDHVRQARAAAFGWYPHDLAENVHVCFNGMTVRPCEQSAP